jgi:hypothetical protein
VPIPAGVEAVALVAALIAAFEMTAEDCRAAHFDGGHHTPLFRGHRCAMVLSISFAVATEHVRHFQPWAVHGTERSEVLRNSARRLNRYGAWEQIQRAGYRAHLAGGNAQVSGGSRQAAMTKQELNGADVCFLFQ